MSATEFDAKARAAVERMLPPKIYDIHADEYRPATQIDLDLYFSGYAHTLLTMKALQHCELREAVERGDTAAALQDIIDRQRTAYALKVSQTKVPYA